MDLVPPAMSAIRKIRRRGLLRPETPHALEGPHRGVQRLWAALAGLAALELRRRRSTVHAAPAKNEEKWKIGKEGRER